MHRHKGPEFVSNEKSSRLFGNYPHYQAHNLYRTHSYERYRIVPFGLDNAHMHEKRGRDGGTSLAISSSMPCIRSSDIASAVLSQPANCNGTRFRERHYLRLQILSPDRTLDDVWR